MKMAIRYAYYSCKIFHVLQDAPFANFMQPLELVGTQGSFTPDLFNFLAAQCGCIRRRT
jgi:hypothetical protein